MAVTRTHIGNSKHIPKSAPAATLRKVPPKDVRWVADWRASDKRQRATFKTKREAEDFLADTKKAIRSHAYVDPKLGAKTTVGQLFPLWIERIETVGARGRGGAAPKTVETYRLQYKNYIAPRWEHTPLSNITYDATAEWITLLTGVKDGKPAGARTRSMVAKLFGRLLNEAVRLRYLPTNPTKDALGGAAYIPDDRPTEKHTYLTMPQLVAIAKQAGDYELMVILAGLCGLRWGEITALTVGQVKLGAKPMLDVSQAYAEVQGRHVLGTTKGGEARQVPIPALIAARLELAIAGRPSGERVFSSERGMVLRNSKFAQTIYKPAIKAAAGKDKEFPSPTFHDLRHTAVSLAISAGSNVKVVQRIAGHSSATLTLDTYAGLFDDDLHDSAGRLNDRLSALAWA